MSTFFFFERWTKKWLNRTTFWFFTIWRH
jgi:hypothetical protein